MAIYRRLHVASIYIIAVTIGLTFSVDYLIVQANDQYKTGSEIEDDDVSEMLRDLAGEVSIPMELLPHADPRDFEDMDEEAFGCGLSTLDSIDQDNQLTYVSLPQSQVTGIIFSLIVILGLTFCLVCVCLSIRLQRQRKKASAYQIPMLRRLYNPRGSYSYQAI